MGGIRFGNDGTVTVTNETMTIGNIKDFLKNLPFFTLSVRVP